MAKKPRLAAPGDRASSGGEREHAAQLLAGVGSGRRGAAARGPLSSAPERIDFAASLARGLFSSTPPATVNEARAKRAELTGITRSPTPVRALMKRCGLRCRKLGALPAQGDPDEQGASQKKSWNLASPRHERERERSSSRTPRPSFSGPFSAPCGVWPGSGSKRPAGAAASMSWAPSTR